MPAGLELSQLLALIPPGGALIAPVITSQGSAVFVLSSGAGMSENGVEGQYVIWLDEFTQDDLNALLVGTEDEPGWLRAYRENRATPTRWSEAIDEFIAQLQQIFMTPIVDKLTQQGIAPGAPLLLMPQGGLGLLPLHALLLEQYSVTVAPSGYALHAARQRLHASNQTAASLLAIVNPTDDLPFTPAEGNTIAALFDPTLVTRLDGSSATLDVVSQHLQPATCHVLHFSGHGFYNWQEAMQSGLVLADGPLTLARLIIQADLSAVRLVILSACETGITDIRQSPDEFLGLPAGLMQAGAPAVVSTLWAVNDLSTMLLMERFYQHYLQDELPLPEALRRAQLWLRAVTAGELANRFTEERQKMLSGGIGLLPAEVISEGYNRFKVDYEPNDCPFVHPYYWAAFTFSGV